MKLPECQKIESMADLETQRYYRDRALDYATRTSEQSMEPAIGAFLRLLAPDTCILDLGCGSGRDLKVFRERGMCAVGLDLSEELAGIAAAYSGCPVLIADIQKLPFAPNSFGAVWAAASLLHVERCDILDTLAGIRGLIRPGGHFFSSVKVGEGERREPDGRYFTYFQPDEWVSLQERVGFRVAPSGVLIYAAEQQDGEWFSTVAINS